MIRLEIISDKMILILSTCPYEDEFFKQKS